jgi:hypothetical protein
VIDAFAAGELSFRRPNVLSEFRAIEEPLVLANIHEHRGSPSVLCKNQRALGLLDLADEPRSVRSELG